MKEQFIKGLLTIALVYIYFLSTSFAHPGRTASDGCHYCRTNCSSWGVARNQRHCHGGTSYRSTNYRKPVYLTPDQKCQKKYPGTIYRYSDGRCACSGDPTGTSTRNSSTRSCTIKNNSSDKTTSENNNKTINCPSYSKYNSYRKLCICYSGYSPSSDKKSCVKNIVKKVKKTPTKKTYDNQNNKSNKSCPANAYLSSYSSTCYCNKGYKKNYSTNKCDKN